MNLLVSRKRLLGNIGDFLWSYGGYLIVSALCDLCGVVLDKSNTRNFVSGCIESLYDTLKTNLSVDGVNYALSLNDELISEFIDFYIEALDGGIENANPILVGKTNLSDFSFPAIYNDKDRIETLNSLIDEAKNKNHYNILVVTGEIYSTAYGTNLKPYWVLISSEAINYDGVNFCNNYNSNCKYFSCTVVFSDTDGYSNINNLSDSSFEFKVNGKTEISKQYYPDVVYYNFPSGLNILNESDTSFFPKPIMNYVQSSEEYKAKYENEPTEIVLDSSIVNIKTKWKKESTDIYIPDGNVENLPSGVSIVYKKYLFKEGNECTDITGGWGKYYTDTHWYWNSANSKGGNIDNTILLNMESGTSNGALCSLGTNEKIDFSKYSKIGIEYSAVVDDIVAGAYIVFRLQIRDNYSGSEIQPSVRNWLLKSTGNLEIFTEAEFNLGNINEMLYLVPILISERWHTGSARIKKIWLE